MTIPLQTVALGCVALLSLLTCCSGEAQARPKVLCFTAIPDDDPTLLTAKYTPVADYLAEALGVPVEYVPVTEYQDSVLLFENGDVQLAWFGGLTGVQARHRVPGACAVVQGEEDAQFYSYFIAHRDTGLTRSAEFPAVLAGRRFTFGSQESTSGRLMPEFFIRQHTNQAPSEFFGHPNAYAGSHDRTVELVASGVFEAGAVSYTKYDRLVREGRVDPDVCRVIWQTPAYADYNFTAHPTLEDDFGAGFTERLRAALLQLRAPHLLAAFERQRLIAANNDDFAGIARLARELGFVRG
ncbi:MAG: putative selenate ABC transporter substrate-binding protein [Planctomycetota bacterium]